MTRRVLGPGGVKITAVDKRSCWNCDEFVICYLRIGLQELTEKSVNIINIEGDKAPGCYGELFDALGRACTLFKPKARE
jgi:hypothetical protein